MVVKPSMLTKIKEGQERFAAERSRLLEKEKFKCRLDQDGILRYEHRIWIPPVIEIKREILQEAHTLKFSIHPGSTKMYQDMRQYYWWPDMKGAIAD